MDAILNRRQFVVGAAGAAAVSAAAGSLAAATAHADESADEAAQWPGEAPEIADSDIVATYDTEILVCGAGHSGMIAALSASGAGAATIVIEKNPTVGTTRSFIGAVGSRAQKAGGVEIDRIELTNELMRYASGRCNQQLLNAWANESGATLDWLESESGFEIRSEPDVGTGYHGIYKCYPTHHRPILSNTLSMEPQFDENGVCSTLDYWLTKLDQTELNDAIVAKAEGYGAQFKYETPLVKLEQDETGRVTGAIAESAEDGGYIRINASVAVILCTGGYESDPVLYEQLNPGDALGTTWALVQPGCTGDGIRAGLWAGGYKDALATALLFDRGGVAPGSKAGYPYQGFPVWYGSQPFLKLDLNGKRIGNESVPYDVLLHSLNGRKGRLEVMLWDANAWAEIEEFHTIACGRLALSETEPSAAQGVGEDVFNGWVKEGLQEGVVFQADTLEELFEQLGVPTETAIASVERYNASAAAGVDEEFGKPAKDLFALENPPYYGTTLGSWTLCTYDGLVIDEDMHVLSAETGDPIEGLYACGNASGAFFCNNYPELVPGLACGRAMVEARHSTLVALGLEVPQTEF